MSFYDDASLVFLPSGGAGKNGKAYSIKPVPEYGNELVTNGGFDTDSYWTKETGWSIANGKATQDGSAVGTGGEGDLVSGGPIFQIGKTYLIKIDIVDYVSGDLKVTSSNIPLSANKDGSYYTYYTAATAYLHIRAGYSSFIGSIDNVSVKEVIVGDADFTFSRGGDPTATRVDSNGLIEKGRENLLENSVWDGVSTDTKPTGWNNQFVSGTGTFDVTATEGQIRFQTLDASSRAFIYSPTITTNGIVVASVYVDEVTTAIPLSNLLIRSANATDLFAYEDGVEINYSDNVQAGKRYSVVFNKTGSTTFRFGVGTSSSTLGDIVLSRPQVEVGLVATEWITSPIGSKGLAGILEHSPRFDYSGGASCPSLLLEPSRTNSFNYSEYFTALNSGSVVVNDSLSPEGLQNANKIIFGASVNDGATMNLSASCSGNTQYTWSAYVKNISGTGVFNLRIDTDTTTILVNQDITATSEWTRVSHTFTTDASATSFGSNSRYRSKADGNEILIWGAQLEEGSYPTSYIPNHSGGSVTRNADAAMTIPTAAFEWDGLADGDSATLFIETKVTAVQNNNFNILSQGGSGVWKWNSTTFFARTNNPATAPSFNMGVDINTLEGSTIKIAFVKDDRNLKMFYNGSSMGVVAIGTAELDWCSHISSAYQSTQSLKQCIGFPSALSDVELEILTGTSYESFAEMATALNYTTYE